MTSTTFLIHLLIFSGLIFHFLAQKMLCPTYTCAILDNPNECINAESKLNNKNGISYITTNYTISSCNNDMYCDTSKLDLERKAVCSNITNSEMVQIKNNLLENRKPVNYSL